MSTKPHAKQSEYENENHENIRNRKKIAKISFIPNLRMSVYHKVEPWLQEMSASSRVLIT